MPKIFLDYGHGGNDPGAVSGSYKEKDFTLSIGQRVKYHLERHGLNVIESRTSDINPSLSERSSKANNNNVDISISIHCNSFGSSTAQGVETYTYGTGTREIQLAKCVHNAIIKDKIYTINRGIKQGDLHMVREITTAAILVEMAFISNPQDRTLLIDKGEQFAIAICKGVLNYYEMQYKNDTVDPGEQKYYRVQVGAFTEKKNADGLAADLRTKGYSAVIKYN